jgi:hypothetical protein
VLVRVAPDVVADRAPVVAVDVAAGPAVVAPGPADGSDGADGPSVAVVAVPPPGSPPTSSNRGEAADGPRATPISQTVPTAESSRKRTVGAMIRRFFTLSGYGTRTPTVRDCHISVSPLDRGS